MSAQPEVKHQPHRKNTSGATINKLLLSEQFALGRWLEARKNELLAERPKRTKGAEDATKELGFKVTESSVRTVSKAAGMFWAERLGRTSANPNRHGNRATLILQGQQIFALKEALLVLCNRLGEASPVSLVEGWPTVAAPEPA